MTSKTCVLKAVFCCFCCVFLQGKYIGYLHVLLAASVPAIDELLWTVRHLTHRSTQDVGELSSVSPNDAEVANSIDMNHPIPTRRWHHRPHTVPQNHECRLHWLVANFEVFWSGTTSGGLRERQRGLQPYSSGTGTSPPRAS